jgi:hypothetical protein
MNTKLILSLLLSPAFVFAIGTSTPAPAAPGGFQPQKAESKIDDEKNLKEVLEALVAEVRLLRQQFERMAQSQQAQLLLEQVQFQEGKVERLERQLQEARDNMANAERLVQQTQLGLQQITQQLEQSTLDPASRSNLDLVRDNMRVEVATARREVQRLQQREAELSQKITDAQTALDNLYHRLDALEKESRKPPDR